MARGRRLVLAVMLVSCLSVSTGVGDLAASVTASSGRFVVVGDVHGEIEGLRTILRAAGVIDEAGRWAGGATTLVQTGDLVERGTAVREVLDLIMRLEEEAPAAGGRVVAMLGNHEAYNLYGFLDYTSTPPEVYKRIFATFANADSDGRLDRARKQWKKWKRRFPQCGAQSVEEWSAGHPPGFVEYFEAFGPKGRYGQWLRRLPMVVQVESNLFSHGGPSPGLDEMGLASVWAVNRRAEAELAAFDEARDYLERRNVILPFFTLGEIYCAVNEELRQLVEIADPLRRSHGERLLEIARTLPSPERTLALNEEGPLWYRGFAKLPDEEAKPVFEALLSHWHVSRIVVGHTPQVGAIGARLGKVFLVDTAMTFGTEAGGRPAALEIVGGRVSAIYPDSSEVLVEGVGGESRTTAGESGWIGPDGHRLPFVDGSEVVDYLQAAEVVANEPIPVGITHPRKLLLEKYGIRAHAIFRHHEEEVRNKVLGGGKRILYFRDSFANEVAAWELSRLLGMDSLPPATLRSVEGRPGSVQLWVEQTMSERERVEKGINPPDRTRFRQQTYDLRVFDNLINNFDRNQGNVLIDHQWKLWLIDHTRSFGREPTLPEPELVLRCSRRLWAALAALEREVLDERLGPYLDGMEIRAILSRRDAIVVALTARIDEIGESRVLFAHGDDADMEDIVVLEPVAASPERVEP